MRCALGLLLALWITPAQAQASFGLRAGVNVSTLASQPFVYGAPRTSGAASVFAEIPVRGRFAVRPEVLFSSEGVRFRPSVETYTTELGTTAEIVSDGGALQAEYVGVGALAAYTVPVAGFSLQPYAGPVLNVKVRENQVHRINGYTTENETGYLGRTVVSGVGGLTVSRGRVGLDMRYAISLTDVINRDLIIGGSAVRSSVGTAALVYRLGR